MSEVVALIYGFLSEKDHTCAEIFKRSFNPDLNCSKDLPPLEDIVEFYMKSRKKKAETKEIERHNEYKSSYEIGTPSDFLTKIVKKRNEEIISDSESDGTTKESPISSSDSDIPFVSAPKRKKTASGTQKIWQKKENSEEEEKSSKTNKSEKVKENKKNKRQRK